MYYNPDWINDGKPKGQPPNLYGSLQLNPPVATPADDFATILLSPPADLPIRSNDDYTQYGSFGNAYSSARKDGRKTFTYNGRKFNTNYAGSPSEQLSQTGITDDQLQSRNIVKDRLSENIYPFGYNDAWFRIKEAVINNVKDPRMDHGVSDRGDVENRRTDVFKLYTGRPQQNNTLQISSFKPTKSNNHNDLYYKINDDGFYDYLLNLNGNLQEKQERFDNPGDTNMPGLMGTFQVDKGKDERGDYLSYYDKWDLAPVDFGKPIELYDRIYYKDYGNGVKRMYYTDDELKSFDATKKNFDTMALQRELLNRGYTLPKSTTADGKLDGILGDETISALLNWQAINNNTRQVFR